MNINETKLGEQVNVCLYRIKEILKNKKRIEERARALIDEKILFHETIIQLGTFDDITSAVCHRFKFDVARLSCYNCDLFELGYYQAGDYVEQSTLVVLKKVSTYSDTVLMDVLEFLAAKFIWTRQTYGSLSYPINDRGHSVRGEAWLNPQRWAYLGYLKNELEYFLMNGRFNNELSRS